MLTVDCGFLKRALRAHRKRTIEWGQMAGSWWTIYVNSAKDNHTVNRFMKNVHRGIRFAARTAILLEPHIVYVHIVQFGSKEIGYHNSVALVIDGDDLTNVVFKKGGINVVFKKGRTNDNAGAKSVTKSNFCLLKSRVCFRRPL